MARSDKQEQVTSLWYYFYVRCYVENQVVSNLATTRMVALGLKRQDNKRPPCGACEEH